MKNLNDKDDFKNKFRKRLYDFVLRLIKLKDNVCRIIGDQLLRSGTSIIGNYIEASSSSSRKDYTNYFNHSLKSSNESKLWVSILRDTGRISVHEAIYFLDELEEFSKIFASSILTLKNRK